MEMDYLNNRRIITNGRNGIYAICTVEKVFIFIVIRHGTQVVMSNKSNSFFFS